ncbi:MAG: DUF3108 domain-containing protein [Gemmatimonadetes bacterium]|nr:DUF3108 domain-containing protein [Gemmatimonadota bacterium]
MTYRYPARASIRIFLSALAVLAATGAHDARASFQGFQQPDTILQAPAVMPFGSGERAAYQVKLGGVAVGSGSLQVLGIESVNGNDTYHVRFRLSGGVPLARVDDKYESWIDTDGLFSRRFKQDQKEVRYERHRTYEFFPERKTYRRTDKAETGTIPTDRPLDDISFLYFARTLPLNVGDTYTLNRYFKEDGNPVVLRVLRRETIRVPAGTFRTIVVRPVIRTKGLFSEGGEAEVYFSDDARKVPVQIRSKVPVVGSLTMHLTEYAAGAQR